MTNGKDSISPLYGAENKLLSANDFKEWNEAYRPMTGLTKREFFAIMAMQSLLTYSHNSIDRIASDASDAADALIRQLNK